MCPCSAPAAPGARTAARFFEFCLQLESPQRVPPHLFEGLPDRSQGSPACTVETMPALGSHLHETGVAQRPELQRNRAECHVGHGPMDVSGAQLALPDQPQYFTPPRRGDGGQGRGVERHGINLDITKLVVKPGPSSEEPPRAGCPIADTPIPES